MIRRFVFVMGVLKVFIHRLISLGKSGVLRKEETGDFGQYGADMANTEDADMKRALEASMSDVPRPAARSAAPVRRVRIASEEDDDEELNAAIQASLRESTRQVVHPQRESARETVDRIVPRQVAVARASTVESVSRGDLDNLDLFSSIIERMDQVGGGADASILYNTEIQGMYAKMGMLAPRLVESLRSIDGRLAGLRGLDEKVMGGCRGYDRMVLARIQGGGYAPPQQQYQPQQYQQQPQSPQTQQYQHQPPAQQQQYHQQPPAQQHQELYQQQHQPLVQQQQGYAPQQQEYPQQSENQQAQNQQGYSQPREQQQPQQQGFNPAFANSGGPAVSLIDDTPLISFD
jgi:hypothetical protein